MVHNGDVTGAMKQMPAAAGTCVPNMSKLMFGFSKIMLSISMQHELNETTFTFCRYGNSFDSV